MSVSKCLTQETTTTALSSHPTVKNIKNNIEELRDDKIKYQNPFISLESEEILTKRLVDFFRKENGIPAAEIKAAAHEGWLEMQAVREDMTKKGKEVLQISQRNRQTRHRARRPPIPQRP